MKCLARCPDPGDSDHMCQKDEGHYDKTVGMAADPHECGTEFHENSFIWWDEAEGAHYDTSPEVEADPTPPLSWTYNETEVTSRLVRQIEQQEIEIEFLRHLVTSLAERSVIIVKGDAA